MKDISELRRNGYDVSMETYSRDEAIKKAGEIRAKGECFAQATYETIFVYRVATKNKNHTAETVDKAEPNNLGYRVKMLCYDNVIGSKPYEDVPSVNPIFKTKHDAFSYAKKLAEEECNGLNGEDGNEPDEGVYFGIPADGDYEKEQSVRVEQYYTPEGDDTGDTNVVTIYSLEEVKYVVIK